MPSIRKQRWVESPVVVIWEPGSMELHFSDAGDALPPRVSRPVVPQDASHRPCLSTRPPRWTVALWPPTGTAEAIRVPIHSPFAAAVGGHVCDVGEAGPDPAPPHAHHARLGARHHFIGTCAEVGAAPASGLALSGATVAVNCGQICAWAQDGIAISP